MQAPGAPAWDSYQAAMVSQLPSELVERVLFAVERIADLNATAELRRRYADEACKTAGHSPAAADPELGHVKLYSPERELLKDTHTRLSALLAELENEQEALADPPKSRRFGAPAAAAVLASVVLVVLAVGWVTAPRGLISASSVADTLASELDGAQSVDCAATARNSNESWSCQVIYPYGDCPAATTAARDDAGTARLAAFELTQKQTPTPSPPPAGREQRDERSDAPTGGCGGVVEQRVRRLDALEASYLKMRASGDRLERGDPPSDSAENTDAGTVPVPANDSTDTGTVTLKDPGRRAFWMFWKPRPAGG